MKPKAEEPPCGSGNFARRLAKISGQGLFLFMRCFETSWDYLVARLPEKPRENGKIVCRRREMEACRVPLSFEFI